MLSSLLDDVQHELIDEAYEQLYSFYSVLDDSVSPIEIIHLTDPVRLAHRNWLQTERSGQWPALFFLRALHQGQLLRDSLPLGRRRLIGPQLMQANIHGQSSTI